MVDKSRLSKEMVDIIKLKLRKQEYEKYND